LRRDRDRRAFAAYQKRVQAAPPLTPLPAKKPAKAVAAEKLGSDLKSLLIG
jgi:hypothetical protein